MSGEVVLWRRADEPSLEYCVLEGRPDGWLLQGTVVLALAGRPAHAAYAIACDAGWRTRTVHVALEMEGLPSRVLSLRVNAERGWWDGDQELVAVRGCSDIDLSITPSTNTLPLRREPMVIGASIEPRAAWVRFPELTVEPLPQRYMRVEEQRYRYESLESGFAAELTVDALGLVRRYGDLWHRVPSQPSEA